MRTAIFVIGLVVALEGLIFIIKPSLCRTMIRFFSVGRLIYPGLVLKSAFGIFFLIAATTCQKPWIIIALGVLVILYCIRLCVMGYARLKSMLNWWLARGPVAFRIIGFCAIALGAIIAYAAGIPR